MKTWPFHALADVLSSPRQYPVIASIQAPENEAMIANIVLITACHFQSIAPLSVQTQIAGSSLIPFISCSAISTK
jgi:hypothetical protein